MSIVLGSAFSALITRGESAAGLSSVMVLDPPETSVKASIWPSQRGNSTFVPDFIFCSVISDERSIFHQERTS